MALSGAAYIENSNEKPIPDSIKSALGKLGFDEIISYNYDKEPTKSNNDIVSYTFAYKRIEHISKTPTFLVAIVVKGTSGNEEWYSNFNIQTGNTHEGFNLAATKLFSSLTDYLDSHDLNNRNGINVKFLVTGHSRGAAVANLVAAKLNDLTWTEQENVFGYTFATPAVSTEAIEEGYKNIFNIINGEDFVTQVPLGNWGYKRYGIDLKLPSRSFYPINSYSRISSSMANTYRSITNEDFNYYEGGTQKVDYLVTLIERLASNINEFYSKKHDLRGIYAGSISETTTTSEYFEILADFLVLAWRHGKEVALADLFFTLAGDYGMITGFFVVNSTNIMGKIQNRVFSAHCAAGYYSWLSSCTPQELFGRLNDEAYPTFKRIRVACPVDVYVYDENHNLVASVVNEAIGENTLAIGVEDEVKTIDLPSDQKYFIEIIATGTGSMDYTVEELSTATVANTVLRTVNFYDLGIEADDEFKGSINDEVFTAVGNYELVKNDDEIIQADKDSLTDGNEQDPNPTPPGPSGPSQGNKPSEGDSPSESDKPSESDTPSSGGSSSGGGTSSSGGSSHGGGYSGSTSSALGNNKTSNSTESTTVTTPSTPSSIFSDVPANHTFATAIAWARDNGIMGGYSDGTFHPNNTTNRQQMWMVLARMSGTYPANMAEARTWAINSGISDGSNAEGIMNRQQMATMVYRFAKSQGITTSGSADLSAYFDNGDVAPYAREAMAWAVGNGLITGVTDGTLKADSTAVRAHFATFLYRFNSL